MNESLIPMDAKSVEKICEEFVNLVIEEEQQNMNKKIQFVRTEIAKMGKIKKFLTFGKIPVTDGDIMDQISELPMAKAHWIL